MALTVWYFYNAECQLKPNYIDADELCEQKRVVHAVVVASTSKGSENERHDRVMWTELHKFESFEVIAFTFLSTTCVRKYISILA